MDFIDEQDRARQVLQLGHNRLQAFLEIPAIAGASQQRAHVQRVDGGLRQHFRHVALDDALGQAFRDRGFANARITHIKRIVLGAAAQDLDGALDLHLPPDQRIDLPGRGFLVQVHAVIRQRVLVATAVRLFLALRRILAFLIAATAAAARDRAGRGSAGRLGDAVADEVHRIQPRHVLQLQEIHRMAFTFAEQGHQHIRSGHFVAPGRLYMDRGALHHALEAGGRLRVTGAIGGEAREILVQELRQVRAQLVEVDAACLQDGRGIGIIGKAQQQMFQGGVFVLTVRSQGQSTVERLF